MADEREAGVSGQADDRGPGLPPRSNDPSAFSPVLHEMAQAFQVSQILFSAHTAGIFPFLEEPRTMAEVAERVQWPPRSAVRMLDALVSMGLVLCEASRYRNSPAAAACLIPGSPAYQGNFLQHMLRASRTWERLDESLRLGRGVKTGRPREGSEEQRDYALAMADIGAWNVSELSVAVDFTPYRRLLDLGSGPGAYAVGLLQKYPELEVVLCDMPAVIELARERLQNAGLLHRCRFVAGDFLRIDWGRAYEVILVSNVLHIFDPKTCQEIIRRCHDALMPGGVLLIRDFLSDSERVLDSFYSRFALHLLLHTEAGELHDARTVGDWCVQAGFHAGQLIALGRKSRLWRAEKPAP